MVPEMHTKQKVGSNLYNDSCNDKSGKHCNPLKVRGWTLIFVRKC